MQSGHCRECGTLISPGIRYCPVCGKSIGKRSLLVWIFLVFACSIYVFVVGTRYQRLQRATERMPPNSGPTQEEGAKDDLIKSRSKIAIQLIAQAKAADHPGIIWRAACQVPGNSPWYKAALRQQERAEKIMDRTIMAPLRKRAAQSLQDNYYRKGMKVRCEAVEGKQPTLRLTWVLFDETTAYQAEELLDNSLIKLGFEKVSWQSGYGESSTNSWEPASVRTAEFRGIRELCESVRRGDKSPDEINATVPNPEEAQ